MSIRSNPDIYFLENLKTKSITTGRINISDTNVGTLNFSGSFTANNIFYRYVLNGNFVVLNIFPVNGIGSSVAAVTSTTALPQEIRPLSNIMPHTCRMLANDVEGHGFVTVLTTGIIRLNYNTSTGPFPSSGLSGFVFPVTFMYCVR